MSYPKEFEQFWLQRAAERWSTTNLGVLADLVRPHVARLSDLFNRIEEGPISNYWADPALQVAYGLFFFPQMFYRTLLILDECYNIAGHKPPLGGNPSRLLDLGCGAGAAGFAALRFFGRGSWHWTATDRSFQALESLQSLFRTVQHILPPTRLELVAADLSGADEPWRDTYDVILASFVLNELADRVGEEECRRRVSLWLQRLTAQGVLVISEPATQQASERLESLRDYWVETGSAKILAPCLHQQPCPLLATRKAWCHEVRRWSPPPLAEAINRKLHLDLRNLKFSFLVVTRGHGGQLGTRSEARLVSPLTPERGKWTADGCAADGQLYRYEILRRHTDRPMREMFEEIERGARVHFDGVEPIGVNTLRARSLTCLSKPSESDDINRDTEHHER